MPAFAESGQNITSPDQSGKSDITATVEASNFDITVPLGLPLYLHSDGSVTTATDAKIENNSQGPIIVKNVKLTPVDNWKLASFTDNYKIKKVNSKELGFQIMNENVLVDGSVNMKAEDWPSIPGNGNIPLNYNGKVPVRSSDGTMTAANLELTFDWDKNKLNIYPSSFYLSNDSKKQLEIMSVTETNNNITFNTSDSNVAIVDSNGIVTGIGPGSAIITAKSGDIEDITTVTVLDLSVSATEGGTASISLNTSNPDNITLGATAYSGYHFKNWTDKDNNVLSTDVLYDTNIVKNSNFIANFEKEKTTEPSNPENPDEEYNVSLTADEGGQIEGNGTYKKGSIITIKAIPSEGYEFLKWSDNNINSTREITIDHNINLTAYFEHIDLDYQNLTRYNYRGINYDLKDNGTASVSEGDHFDPGNTNLSGDIAISDTVIDNNGLSYSVTSIGEYAFHNCNDLTSITIPNSVTSIGWYAFTYCDSLTSVAIPDSVAYIGYGAFANCSSLKSVTIPNSVTSIDDWAFSNCRALTNITIPDSVIYINIDAFYSWDSNQTINIEGKSSYQDTIDTGWEENWNRNCNAQINYLG